MSEKSIIVWDLETVPDLAAAARMLDLPNAADAEVREALGSGFPKQRSCATGARHVQHRQAEELLQVGKRLSDDDFGNPRAAEAARSPYRRPW